MNELFATARSQVNQLDNPVTLRDAAERVADVAASLGATHLVAASPYAERIVGAAMLLHAEALRGGIFAQHDHDLAGHVVLVVDVNLASGTSMAHAARWARRSGASRVDGVVLQALPDAVGPLECGVDGLQVLTGELRR